MSDRSVDSGSEVTWTLSAKSWMKLSEASGVPVTFIGDKIFVPRAEPGGGYVPQKPIPSRLFRFWDHLGPEEQDLVVSFVDAWADRFLSSRKIR